jgi:hypothetical protein
VSLAVAWIVFPAVLVAVSLGCGLLLGRLAGGALPGVLLLPAGFAVVIVAADLATSTAATARLALPLVLGLAVLGLGLALPWRPRLEAWTAGSALLVFLAYGAPVYLSGAATFAGYIKLDDTATWLALADNALRHGRSMAGLAPSTYKSVLESYLGTGYPLGSMVPLGIGARVVGQDAAWVFQPYLAFQGALLALALNGLLAGLVRSARSRAVVVFLAAQPALLYGYSLWGAIKELVTVPLLALLVVFALRAWRTRLARESLVPLAVVVAALVAVLNVGGAIWIALGLLPVLMIGLRVPARRVAGFLALVLALSLPTLATMHSFYATASQTLTPGDALGNLFHRLSVLQVFGIWPVGDFRTRPHDLAPTYVLVAVVLLAAGWGLWQAWRQRRWELPLYVTVSVVGCALLASFGSPWVDAKALATASPALLLAALAGAAVAFERGLRVEALVVAAAIAAGVLWSNALAYREVWLAPRDQLVELQQIGQRFAGQGPALMAEYQPLGARHFLRALGLEDAGELRMDVLPLRDGRVVPKGGFADIDDFTLQDVLRYPTLVLTRSPVGSRPPSPYSLVWQGRFYEVWRRSPGPPVLVHLSLGSDLQPAAVPSCAAVVALARIAAAHGGSLAAVVRPPAIVVDPARVTHPPEWALGAGGGVYPYRPGEVVASVDVPRAGRYGLWLGGSYPGRLEASVDGRAVGGAEGRLEHQGQYVELGRVDLPAGRHVVRLDYKGASARPGTAAHLLMPMGPLVLSTATADLPVRRVAPADARSLCGQPLDWVEALGAG